MLENRSFDHMLGLLPNPAIDGVHLGAYGNYDHRGRYWPQASGAKYQGQLEPDPGHEFIDTYLQVYGVPYGQSAGAPTMAGFARSYENAGGAPGSVLHSFEPSQLPVLTGLASSYAVCDRWFAAVPGPTPANRAFAHFGTSFGRVDSGAEYLGAKAPSIFRRLADARVEAAVYYRDVTMCAFFPLKSQPSRFGLLRDFVRDCADGTLPAYSFVEPAYFPHDDGATPCDQHPDNNVEDGESFIRAVYEALRVNSTTWQRSVLLIVWDEHGGLADHVAPPTLTTPAESSCCDPRFAFDRLGVRVPAVVVSPYVIAGTVDHTQYDHSSIPATVAAQFIGDPAANAHSPREREANTFLPLLRGPYREDTPDLGPTRVIVPRRARTRALGTHQRQLIDGTRAALSEFHAGAARRLRSVTISTTREATRFARDAAQVIAAAKPRS